MKFCMKLSNGHPFALAKFQLGHKGQRPEGRKVKGQNFQKFSEAFLTITQSLCSGFTSIFVLKMVIVDYVVVTVHCAEKSKLVLTRSRK